ncbi:bifunctional alpha,alpha-trehalose-phosphate synthase (UDP-forming)/trehalose-phosphatase [Sorangium sp. So ce315]|uniref:bifunctional alpha,alpha-trehalose-phosphate synthase (UDP-forming)/trehalose-phosphatase n=1 Tax=Sorangium sp. So ce315 TaxID=3133299 RepID=UPI003F625370
MARLLIVSNRLPISVRVDRGALCLTRSSGGLAAAMRGPHERMRALWIGWPGSVAGLTPEQRQDADAALAGVRAVPVHLGATEQHRFYDGFSNGVLWPLFHYLLDKVNVDAELDWEAYQRVNERFADAVAERYTPGDVIWVHDYQLMLLPALLRRRLPGARIGFFLHVPFPSADVFRILPWREQIARGLLGADLIGFHTAGYRRNFAASAAHVLGLDPDEAAIEHDGRRVALGVHPISIDAAEIARLAAHPAVREEAARIRAEAGGRKIVLGIDRLDYTKGIPRRLLAIERFLEREPELREEVRFIQLAVPTREKSGAYADFRRVVHETVGRINGQHGTTYATPIHYVHRSLPLEQVVALYVAADAMLVTPLRDGMNLVAKEYIAARVDDDGALILSEFAGAASELAEAVSVNPYDIGSVAAAVKRALAMPPAEQRTRMAALRRRVAANDVHVWAQSFLDDLDRAAPGPAAAALTASAARRQVPESVVERVRNAPQRVWILDYDGTLVPFASVPDLAAPDEELLALLRALSERDRVHVVSGRRRADIERWFGALPLHLHAEHGFWSRPRTCDDWVPLESDAAAWKREVRAVLEDFTRRTPGSFIEEKTVTLAWHYRTVEPELAGEHVRALRARLAERVSAADLELLGGSKVLEIRPRGVHKGRVVPLILDDVSERAEVIAIGDDRTDEDIFAALPPSACTIHVGGNDQSLAAYRLPNPRAVRSLLRSIHA